MVSVVSLTTARFAVRLQRTSSIEKTTVLFCLDFDSLTQKLKIKSQRCCETCGVFVSCETCASRTPDQDTQVKNHPRRRDERPTLHVCLSASLLVFYAQQQKLSVTARLNHSRTKTNRDRQSTAVTVRSHLVFSATLCRT